jgi:hypothetical protein
MTSFTKNIALHHKISADGEDVSNAFRTFGQPSTKAVQDASGFSVSGADEQLVGAKTQTFEGEMFNTPESFALFKPLFDSGEVFPMTWQPEGLVDSSREVYYGNVQMTGWGAAISRGNVEVFPTTFITADSDGIQTYTPT